jgi:hypothetical protein
MEQSGTGLAAIGMGTVTPEVEAVQDLGWEVAR